MRKTALVLAMVMILTMLPVSTAFAAIPTTEEAFTLGDSLELSATLCTSTNKSGLTNSVACPFDSSDYSEPYQTYKLNVLNAGTYKVEAYTNSYNSPLAYMAVYRQGKNASVNEKVFSPNRGDVMLTKGTIAWTGAWGTKCWNDLGTINLESGEQTIAFSGLRAPKATYYVFNYRLTRVGDIGNAPIVVSFTDAESFYDSSLTDTKYNVENPLKSTAYSVPYIQFWGGDYQIYDLNIPKDGYYKFDAVAGGANTYTITLNPGEETENVLFNAVSTSAEAVKDYNCMEPAEIGKVNLKAGNYKMKVLSNGSNHYSYLKITKLCDEIPYEDHKITDNKTLQSVPTKNYISAGKSTTFSWMNWNAGTNGNYDFGYGYLYRNYVVYCEKEALYDLSMNYRSTISTNQAVDLYINNVKSDRIDIVQTDPNKTGVTANKNLGTVYLNKGENVIKMQSVNPSGTQNGAYYLNSFTLTPSTDKIITVDEATNKADLSYVRYETSSGSGVYVYQVLTLSEDNSMTYAVNMDESGYYNVRALVSSDVSEKTVGIQTTVGAKVTAQIKGKELMPYEYVDLGYMYFAKGEQTLTVSLDEGSQIKFKSLVISSPEVVLRDSSSDVLVDAKDGSMTATAYLDGMFSGKTVKAVVAVYDGNYLVYSNAADVTVSDGKASVTLSGVALEEGKTYTTKVFIWDDMRGVVRAF